MTNQDARKGVLLGPESERRPIDLEQVRKNLDAAYSGGRCMAVTPSGRCTARPIRSHTLPRASSLTTIAESGHVEGFRIDRLGVDKPSGLRVERIGLGRASTFSGFCGPHDRTFFAPLEGRPVHPDAEQALLLFYRSVTRETYMKQGLVKAMSFEQIAPIVESYKDPYIASEVAILLRNIRTGGSRGLQDISQAELQCDGLLANADFSDIAFMAVQLDYPPDVMCSTLFQPDVDFLGSAINLPGAFGHPPCDAIAFNLIADGQGGGLIVFSWLKSGGSSPEHLVRSLVSSHKPARWPAAAVRVAYEYSENVFWRPSWWAGLPEATQDRLTERFLFTADPMNSRKRSALADDGLEPVKWAVSKTVTNIGL